MAKSFLEQIIETINSDPSITKFSDNHSNDIGLSIEQISEGHPTIVLFSDIPSDKNIHLLNYNNRLENLEINQNSCIVTTDNKGIAIIKKINTPDNFEHLIVAGVNSLCVNNHKSFPKKVYIESFENLEFVSISPDVDVNIKYRKDEIKNSQQFSNIQQITVVMDSKLTIEANSLDMLSDMDSLLLRRNGEFVIKISAENKCYDINFKLPQNNILRIKSLQKVNIVRKLADIVFNKNNQVGDNILNDKEKLTMASSAGLKKISEILAIKLPEIIENNQVDNNISQFDRLKNGFQKLSSRLKDKFVSNKSTKQQDEFISDDNSPYTAESQKFFEDTAKRLLVKMYDGCTEHEKFFIRNIYIKEHISPNAVDNNYNNVFDQYHRENFLEIMGVCHNPYSQDSSLTVLPSEALACIGHFTVYNEL